MKQFLSIAILGLYFCAGAAAGCERLPIDPEFPAGLAGNYDILGQSADRGDSYSGTLSIEYGKKAYRLTRDIKGQIVHGQAWIERCGVDKIMKLIVRYDTKPALGKSLCFFSGDGDNYYRVSCKSSAGGHKRPGLEAWFQKP